MGRVYKALTLTNEGRSVEVVAIVDTGSDSCVISKRIADFLGIRGLETEMIEVASGEIIETEIGDVVIESKFDGIKSKVFVNITDLPFKRDRDENIDMIVGVDFLQENGVSLKFRKGLGVEK